MINHSQSVHKEIENYLNKNNSKKRFVFDLKGTSFQKKVWSMLQEIPKGESTTYGEIAHKLGDKKLARAVGTAIGNNPIGYIIPCHRVLTSQGGIGGFRWGIARKKQMLSFEGLVLH